MGMRHVFGAVALGLGWASMALAEGDLARSAPPERPADLVEISAAPVQPLPDVPAPAAVAAPPEALVTAPQEPPRDPNRGQVTNLPLPRFVTLKTNEGNARRGPGLTHRIDWVFTHAGMPLRVTAEFENWRRIEDQEGVGGWIHYTLLSGARSAMVITAMADFREEPDDAAHLAFQAENGVMGRLLECQPEWCRMNVDGTRAWVRKTALWGVLPAEIME